MRIFDPHIHMTSRTTDDYRAMAAHGVRAVVEPAFWLGQPRTNPGSFADYFDSLYHSHVVVGLVTAGPVCAALMIIAGNAIRRAL